MRVIVLDAKLVRIERPLLLDRYVALTPHGWCDDKSGLAVCPITRAAINRALHSPPSRA